MAIGAETVVNAMAHRCREAPSRPRPPSFFFGGGGGRTRVGFKIGAVERAGVPAGCGGTDGRARCCVQARGPAKAAAGPGLQVAFHGPFFFIWPTAVLPPQPILVCERGSCIYFICVDKKNAKPLWLMLLCLPLRT